VWEVGIEPDLAMTSRSVPWLAFGLERGLTVDTRVIHDLHAELIDAIALLAVVTDQRGDDDARISWPRVDAHHALDESSQVQEWLAGVVADAANTAFAGHTLRVRRSGAGPTVAVG
jgi:hypothetical protein